MQLNSFRLLNDSELCPPKSIRKVKRSVNCPDLVEQIKMFRKFREMRRVLFSFSFTKWFLGFLICCLKYFYHHLKYLWPKLGSIKQDFIKFWSNFRAYILSFPRKFAKTGHLFFSFIIIILGNKFCRLAEYSPSRDKPRDFSKQTALSIDIYAIDQYVIVKKNSLDMISEFYGKTTLNLAAIESFSLLNEN